MDISSGDISVMVFRRVIRKDEAEFPVDSRMLSVLMEMDGGQNEFLSQQLHLAVGPIAEVLIEDAVADLGYSLYQFPSHRAAELVELLARQIQRQEKRTAFEQAMVKKLRDKDF